MAGKEASGRGAAPPRNPTTEVTTIHSWARVGLGPGVVHQEPTCVLAWSLCTMQ